MTNTHTSKNGRKNCGCSIAKYIQHPFRLRCHCRGTSRQGPMARRLHSVVIKQNGAIAQQRLLLNEQFRFSPRNNVPYSGYRLLQLPFITTLSIFVSHIFQCPEFKNILNISRLNQRIDIRPAYFIYSVSTGPELVRAT